MTEGIIYCYHSPSNKYYIGQTIHENKRKRQHTQLSNIGRKKKLRHILQINQDGKIVKEWDCAYNINTFNHNTIATYLKRYGGECNYKGYIWRYKK